MANEKKVFSIQINGIKESTDAIAFLNDQLKDLEKNIKDLEKKQIKIKSGTSTSGSGSKSNKSQLTEEQKIQQQINKEIEKRAAMQTKEYQELLKQKQATKDIANEQKQISTGSISFDDSGVKQYANSLAGMKARLADLKAEVNNWDKGNFEENIEDLPDKIINANKEIYKLTNAIKAFEQSQGTFSRGVGDYYNEFKRALADSNKEIEKTGKTLLSLQNKKSALEGLRKTAQIGSDEWKKYDDELKQVNQELSKLSQNGIKAEDIINPKVVITVNDLTLEFDDLGQSVNVLEDKLYQLTAAGQKNSEEYKNIQAELIKVKQTIADTDAEIDRMTSRTRGLDKVVEGFQGLTAVMQVGVGVAGLFGKSQEDLEKTLQKVSSLMSVAQGLQEIHNQLTQKGTVLNKLWNVSMDAAQKVLNKYSKTSKAATVAQNGIATAMSKTATETKNVTTATKAATVATNTLTTAQKAFKFALASTGIGILVVALGSLVSWLVQATDKSEKFAKSQEAAQKAVNGFNNELSWNLKINQQLKDLGYISELEKLDYDYVSLLENLKRYNNELAKYGANIDDIKKKMIADQQPSFWERMFSFDTSGVSQITVPDTAAIEKYQKEQLNITNILTQYKSAQEAIIKGEKNRGKSIDELNKELALAIRLEVSNLKALEDTEQPLEDFIANIGNLKITLETIKDAGISFDDIFGENAGGAGLQAFIEGLIQAKEEYNNQINEIKKIGIEASRNAYETDLQTFNKTLNKRIELLNHQKDRELEIYKAIDSTKSLEDNIKEIEKIDKDAAEGIRKNVLAINKKYDKLILDEIKSTQRKELQMRLDIESDKISVMQEGLEKQLKIIDNQRQKEILSAESSEEMVGEKVAAINLKYDKIVLQAKEAFYKQREEQYKQFAENYRQIANSFNEYEYQKSTQQVSVGLETSISETSFDTDKSLNESVNEQRAFYEKLIQLKQDAALKLAEINLNKVTDDKYDSLQTENQRYQERLKLLEDYQKQGIITNEEYNTQLEHEQQQHADMIKQIEEQAWNKQLEIDRNYVNERKQIIAEGNNGVIQSFNDYFNEIQRLEDKAITPNKNTGIINYKDTKANLTKVKQEYKSLMDNIKQQLNTLEQEFANGKISFDDFKTAKKELKSLEDSANQSMENVNQTLSTLVVTVADSISQFVGQYLGVLSGLWSTYNDIVMSSLDYQQEMLEEEYDMLEDAYQKQEELAQKHTNKLDEIESELKDSRGDRRQHLIDQLAAEREAQIAALAEEQKIAKQKEQNQKKQDALEKKRREQEKKNSIVQATINTFTAMTNALAVQPWFVGLALSAVALAMGMAQVANIKKQKYADGGLLNGKPHSQGGIPVGNTGIEVEGNEYVVNKKSTEKNLPLIEYINSNRRTLTRDDLVTFFDNGKQSLVNKKVRAKYAEGGQLPEVGEIDVKSLINYEPEPDNRPIVVSVVDIINATENIRNVQSVAGL